MRSARDHERWGALFVAALAALVFAAAPLAAQRDRPDVPGVDPRLARLVPPSPAPEGFIADVPGIIPAAARVALNERIHALQDSGFGDIGVAILPSAGDYDPVEVAVAIYRTWRIGRIDSIGSARRNLGALLLIVPKELSPDHKGQCWISTGTGAEGDLTDAASAAICRDSIIPHLREREYAAAVGAGVTAIAARLHRDPALGQSAEQNAGGPLDVPRHQRFHWWYALGGFGAAVVALFGAVRWRRDRPRSCPTCGQQMHRLSESADDAELNHGQQIEEKLRSVDYDVWRCPAGHEVVLPYKATFTSYHVCPSCHVRAEKTTRRMIDQPTYTSTGLAEDTHHCEACGETRTERVRLPRRTPPSSGGGGGGGSSGGGGGGFGGSGSTSGGGGGSSY